MGNSFRIKGPNKAKPKVVASGSAPEELLSVSLRYWHSGSQCISSWQSKELEGYRKTIDKIQSLTATKLKNEGGLSLKSHKAKPATGFSRPKSLSPEIKLCEVRASGKARLHGVIIGNVFHLVWLDRNHEVFPE